MIPTGDALSWDTYTPRTPTAYEQACYLETLAEFNQLAAWRNTTAAQWEEIAELIDPPSRNTFYYANFNWPGQKKTDRQVDATGMLALGRFGAILDSLLTPRNMYWHGLAASNPYVQKQRGVKLYFDEVAKTCFRYRYKSIGNFAAQNQGVYRSLGAYGTAGLFLDQFDDSLFNHKGIRYKNIPIGELYIRENHQGVIDGFCRVFRLNARQAWEKWGKLGTFPATLLPALKSHSEMTYLFIHRVVPRDQQYWDPQMLDHRRFKWASYYVSIDGQCLLEEGGYNTFPLAASRYMQTPQEVNGRGPASDVLPSLKTLNAEKRTFLKQGHRAADPVLLTSDDGLVDGVSLRPGALNKGGISPEGKPLITILPTGEIQVTKEMMEEERNLINDAFLVTLFQILTETPTMTATEVIERTNEKGILLAPTVGRQQDEYLGPMIDREIDILNQQGLLPPMPPILREAEGEYEVVYTNPLARAMRAQEAAGFIRSVETVKEVVSITQDPSLLDRFDFDTAMPEIAEIQGVPPHWMASDDQVAAKRQARAAAQQRQEQIQAAPAQAAILKAQAVAAKAGAPVPGAQAPAGGGPPLAQQVGG